MRCVFVTEEIFFRIFDAMNDMVIAVQLLSSWHFLLDETGYAERPKKGQAVPRGNLSFILSFFLYLP